MTISKKRIRSIDNNFPSKLINTIIVPTVILDEKHDKERLKKIGFTEKLELGETLLPAKIGPVTRFNSEGKEVIDKTKGKETRYREIEWCWNQWAGRGETERVCDNRLVRYERWHRDFIEPPSIEITISKKEAGKIYITTPKIFLSDENHTKVINQINLLLEIFGSCHILSQNLIPAIVPTVKLNWQILPPGRRPWAEQKKLLKPLLDLIKDSRQKPVVDQRLESVNSLGPDFTATGTLGFRGYVVFGFPKKNVYILESALYGNAIYVFNQNWENLTKMTKAEIINGSLQIERITHNGERANWVAKLEGLLSPSKK